MDGSVKPEGIAVQFESAQQVGMIMERMVRQRAYDVAELGFTYYLRTLRRRLAGAPFIAIPVFPNRIFRHAAIFVNTTRGITRPQDLAGRKVGELHRYGHDAGIWSKGVLSDEYGVAPKSMVHYVGGMDGPNEGADWAPFDPPAGAQIHQLKAGQALDAMLVAGEIDALFSAWKPPSLMKWLERMWRGSFPITTPWSATGSRAPASFRSCIRSSFAASSMSRTAGSRNR